ncbi:DUF4234 domain-containing protein [Planctomycetota bacterium]
MKSEFLKDCRRQNVWALLGLAMVTAGIYLVYWLRRQTRSVNKHLPSRPISGLFFPVAMTLVVLNIVGGFLLAVSGEDWRMLDISQTIGSFSAFFALIWTLRIRNRIHEILSSQKRQPTWFSLLFTLLFEQFYVQYKLNKLKAQGVADPAEE